MTSHRVFVSQTALDGWLADGIATLDGTTLASPTLGRTLELTSAVLVLREVSGAADARGLVGRVKRLDSLTELGGEYCSGSLIVGDNAYEVTDGFIGSVGTEHDDAAPREDAPVVTSPLELLAAEFLKAR